MDMQINKHFLRQEREKRAWSQSHLADVADLSMRTVQRIEHSGVASMESAKALAAALDLELAALVQSSPAITPHRPMSYRLFAAIGTVLVGVIAVGWWSTAAAQQVKLSLSIEAPNGTYSDFKLLNTIGEQSEMQLDNQFRVLVNSRPQGEYLLLEADIYHFVEAEYQLMASPSLLIEDQEPSSLHLEFPNGDKVKLLVMADY